MEWINKEIDLGTIEEGSEIEVRFQYIDEDNEIEILSITPTCTCCKARLDKKEKQIIVKYLPGTVPFHLEHKRGYNSTKKIIIQTKDKTDILVFNCFVRQRF